MTQELKNCPFCGGEAECSPSMESYEEEREDCESLSWAVGCSCTAFVGPWSTEAEAIAAWNTRAATIPDPQAFMEAARGMREALGRIATVDMGGGFLGAQACRQVASEAILAFDAAQGEQ